MSTETSVLLNTAGMDTLKDARVGIVATEWNHDIVALQMAGAQRIATQIGATIAAEIFVPGSFELPFACKELWSYSSLATRPIDAIIAFGAVIRGGTPHFDYVCKAVTEGITQLNLTLPIPVIFGVLTVDNHAQALDRLGGAHGHKGEESMITALKMIQVQRTLKELAKG
jgi:6,7-dimethyl-8-ribityllumazine synthase